MTKRITVRSIYSAKEQHNGRDTFEVVSFHPNRLHSTAYYNVTDATRNRLEQLANRYPIEIQLMNGWTSIHIMTL